MDTLLPGVAAALNSHPIFVHFPIALWCTALLFWGLSVWRGSEELFRFGRWLLYLAMLGALCAVVSGLVATSAMGHDAPGHDFVHIHRNFMILASALGAATALVAFAFRAKTSSGARWAQLALLLGTVIVSLLGADRGALLVYQHGVGTHNPAPAPAPENHEHDHKHEHK